MLARIRVFRRLESQSRRPLENDQRRVLLRWAENAAMLTFAFQEFVSASQLEIQNMEDFLHHVMQSKIMLEVIWSPMNYHSCSRFSRLRLSPIQPRFIPLVPFATECE